MHMLDALKIAQKLRMTNDIAATETAPWPNNTRNNQWQQASLSSSENKVSIGICIRDADVCFLPAKTIRYSSLCSVDVGKALRLFEALQ